MQLTPILTCFIATLVSLTEASPVALTSKAVTPTHDCSVFIQRWSYHGNLFDVTYHDHYVVKVPTRQQIWIQESWPDVENGEYLPDRQFGSHVLKVKNVANPQRLNPFSATDTGKVTVEWGSYRGNSWETTSGCKTNPAGYGTGNERATYVCNFKCDVQFGGSGPY